MTVPRAGDRIEQEMSLDVATIRAGARLVGDQNPLHHDEAIAAASRFGELIASGAHTSALLAGLVSQGFGPATQDDRGCVGMDYAVRFVAPVRSGRRLHLSWTVEKIEVRRPGTVATLVGRIADLSDDAVLMTARMTLLCFA